MELTHGELLRYSRHIQLSEVGTTGQELLKKASVLVVGAGGLGCPALQYLTAAGVGRIGIIDYDRVDETNLQRQVLYGSSSLGAYKAVAAQARLQDLNPLSTIEAYPEKLTARRAVELFDKYDLIVDGSDNFETRYVVNDAAVISGKPFVYGAIYRFQGQVSVFNYRGGPTYRCLYPSPPPEGSVPNCAEVGVLGVLAGIIGTQQANEALKIILGLEGVLSGTVLIYDSRSTETTRLAIRRKEDAAARAQEGLALARKAVKEQRSESPAAACSSAGEDDFEIDPPQLEELLASGQIQMIDIRGPEEEPRLEELQGLHLPMEMILEQPESLSDVKQPVLYCTSGTRSRFVVQLLRDNHHMQHVRHLRGGIGAWLRHRAAAGEIR